jgi:inosose dehydratase
MRSTRRHFLRLAAGSVAASTLLSAARGAAAKAAVRPIGFSLYGMKAIPLLDAIDHCARIGYRQLELSLIPGFAAEPSRFSAASRRAVRERIRSQGLELSSLLININLLGDERAHAANLDVIIRAGELAHQLNDAQPPVVETIMGGKAGEWESTKDQLAARLRAWADAAETSRITLCVKAHAGHAVNSPDRLLWIHCQVNHPRLALTYDYSHFQVEGFDLEQSLRAILPHTRFIHMKDVVPNEKPARFLLVGEGSIDYPRYLRWLEELKYRGPVIVEVSAQIHNRAGYDGVKAAEQGYAVLRRAMQA